MSSLVTFIVCGLLLVMLILVAVYAINPATVDYEKRSSYECGFEPFGDSRSFFDVQSYIVGLLFIVFDLEIVFSLPFAVESWNTSIYSYASMLILFIIVVVGFIYEWSEGLSTWVPEKFYIS